MMLHNFSHFMQIWLFPPGLILLLMLASFILSMYSKRCGRVVLFSAFVIFWVLSTPVITQLLIDKLQLQYAPLLLDKVVLNKNSVIVVLGSGIESAKEYANKHMVSAQTLSRIHYAAYLHKKIAVPIIVSGGNRDSDAHSEADLMSDVLANSYGVAVLDKETKSTTTEEESKYLRPLLQQQGFKTIYLITNAWHMPRSMYAFKKAFNATGMQIIPAPMGYISLRAGKGFANYLPSLNALNTSFFALHEYLGIMYYHL